MDSDNEKCRSEREAEQLAKRKHPGGANAAKKAAARDVVPVHPGTIGQNSRGSRPPVARLRLVGPCYRCVE